MARKLWGQCRANEARHILPLLVVFLLMLSISTSFAQVTTVPNSISFQGRLTKPDGTPVPDGNYTVRIRLYNSSSGNTVKYEQTLTSIKVKNGIIAILIGLLTADIFNGDLWLGLKIGNDPELMPRQQLVSVPYAFKSGMALTVPDGSVTNVKIAPGTLTADKFAANIFNPLAWLLKGNSGVTTGFLGTTDNQPLEFRVKGRRAMQYQYAENTATAGQEYRSMNVLGGSEVNSIGAGVVGATIAGGGQDKFTLTDLPNRVLANFGTVGGGYSNSITADSGTVGGGALNTASSVYAMVGGGYSNTASNFYAMVGGGESNTASGILSTVGGGSLNTASSYSATVGGGYFNTASGLYSTVAGGYSHLASGQYSTVAGGLDNTAAGDYSFAAGRRARANHAGSFVWADSANADFASDAPNTFNVRAASGVNLYANTDVFGILHSVTLYVDTLPFGDYRNVQWDSVTKQFFYDNSSRKHKQNITPLEDDFDKLLQAVPVTYTRPAAPGRWEIGFIAEEFHDLGLKKLVDYSDKGEVEGINYEKICLYLTAIAKKQNNRLITQEKENAALKAKNAELEARLDALAEAVAKLQANQK